MEKRKRVIIFLCILIILGISLLLHFFNRTKSKNYSIKNIEVNQVEIECDQFEHSIDSRQEYENLDHTIAGIVPHHLLAGDMIGGFIEGVSEREIDTVVVIGPKHVKENASIVTSDATWSSLLGFLQVDQEFIQELENIVQLEVVNNKDIMEADHSISSLVPYIMYYMPQVKMVPILLSGYESMEELEILANFLANKGEAKNILVLGSVDFSHYLNQKQSQEKDEETIRFIEQKQYNRIKQLNNDYVDSPNTLITIMKYVEKRGASDLRLLDHSSSLEKLGLPEQAKEYKAGLTTYMIYASQLE